ncbi:MAG: DUF2723 domain-containing protein [Deltaproteobacteria bacterium]|nr:DUF2723 domain-containing protein [Deltaproteobacteria bacterium]
MDSPPSRHLRWSFPAAIAALGASLRAAAVPSALASTDEVNFALALERFDLSLHQPHPPGYPLFVLAARATGWLTDDPALALALPGITASAVMIAMLMRALWPLLGSWGAIVSGLGIAAHPLLVQVGGAPGSDGLALALAGCALAVVLGAGSAGAWRIPSASALLGVSLGVRPSNIPLAVAWTLLITMEPGCRREWRRSIAGLVLGIATWIVPFALYVGPTKLLALNALHTEGHFTSWGGVALDLGPLAIVMRIGKVLGHALAGVFPLVLAAGIAALSKRQNYRQVLIPALASLPLLLWAALAQNAEHERHAAPLALVACLGLGTCFTRMRPSFSRPVVAVAALPLIFSLTETLSDARRPSDKVEAVTWTARSLGHERVLLLGTHVPRIAAWHAPLLRVGRVQSGADVARIARDFGDHLTVVVTSEVPHLDIPELSLVPLHHFGQTTVYAARARSPMTMTDLQP